MRKSPGKWAQKWGAFFLLGGLSCAPKAAFDAQNVDLRPAPPMAEAPGRPIEKAEAPGDSAVACSLDEGFAATLPIAEASAAAEVELLPGKREILVVSDSGNHGAAIAFAVGGDGASARKLMLPLDARAGDDLEGLAWKGGRAYALTSSGAVLAFSPDGKGSLRRDGDAYRLGEPPTSCEKLDDGNCGRNYEGLCLRAKRAPGRCDGYAAGRATASLYCVSIDGSGRLAADLSRPPIKLAVPGDALSDCAFGAEGGPAEDVLLVTTNIHGGNATYVVDESSGRLARLDAPPTLNNEGVAIDRTGALYVMMDSNSSPSFARRATCEHWR
jgi:hypothetical protein